MTVYASPGAHLMELLFGLLDLGLWGHLLAAFIMVQLTVMGVTLYLHRDAAHRSVDLHPALRHFFRLWVWMTSGMLTKDWVAVHRKHHARCETEEDPHSPQVLGLHKVLLEGAELYRVEANKPETLEKFGRGTPDDWLERKVYSRFPIGGIVAMAMIDLVLFGVAGITIFAVQMISMPLCAAGVINGVGHYYGYRNFECSDAATNIVPWGVILGGEELHNNHHAFPSSARFSVQPWEFDIGWFWLQVFSALGLARVRRVAPKPEVLPTSRPNPEMETVHAIVVARMHVLRDYTRRVTLPVLDREIEVRAAAGDSAWARMKGQARRLMTRRPQLLDAANRQRFEELLAENARLRTVVEFRERLQAMWEGATKSNDKLVADLREWIAQAEASGIDSLQRFAERLRAYSLQPQPA